MVGQCTSYAHACINPVIYTFAMPKLRRQLSSDFKEAWSRLCQTKNKGHNASLRHRNDDRAEPLTLVCESHNESFVRHDGIALDE